MRLPFVVIVTFAMAFCCRMVVTRNDVVCRSPVVSSVYSLGIGRDDEAVGLAEHLYVASRGFLMTRLRRGAKEHAHRYLRQNWDNTHDSLALVVRMCKTELRCHLRHHLCLLDHFNYFQSKISHLSRVAGLC
jgi:hypothetical protein